MKFGRKKLDCQSYISLADSIHLSWWNLIVDERVPLVQSFQAIPANIATNNLLSNTRNSAYTADCTHIAQATFIYSKFQNILFSQKGHKAIQRTSRKPKGITISKWYELTSTSQHSWDMLDYFPNQNRGTSIKHTHLEEYLTENTKLDVKKLQPALLYTHFPQTVWVLLNSAVLN